MAQIIDSLGRTIESANLTLEQMRGMVSSLMQGNVGKPTSLNETAKEKGLPQVPELADQTATLEKIQDILKEISDEFLANIEDMKSYVEEIVDFMSSFDAAKADKKLAIPDKEKL